MKTNTTNLILVLIGTILISVGLFRQFPVKVNKSFLWNVAPMSIMLVLVIAVAFKFNRVLAGALDGRTIIQRGTDDTMLISSSFLFTIVMLMPLIGFSKALTPVFQTQIAGMLSSWTGWVYVFPLSFTSAGGSGYSGVVMHMWKTAQHLQPLMLYFLTITPLTAFSIFQVRSLGLGPEIAGKMYTMNWISAVWLLPMYLIYWKFFFKM